MNFKSVFFVFIFCLFSCNFLLAEEAPVRQNIFNNTFNIIDNASPSVTHLNMHIKVMKDEAPLKYSISISNNEDYTDKTETIYDFTIDNFKSAFANLMTSNTITLATTGNDLVANNNVIADLFYQLKYFDFLDEDVEPPTAELKIRKKILVFESAPDMHVDVSKNVKQSERTDNLDLAPKIFQTNVSYLKAQIAARQAAEAAATAASFIPNALRSAPSPFSTAFTTAIGEPVRVDGTITTQTGLVNRALVGATKTAAATLAATTAATDANLSQVAIQGLYILAAAEADAATIAVNVAIASEQAAALAEEEALAASQAIEAKAAPLPAGALPTDIQLQAAAVIVAPSVNSALVAAQGAHTAATAATAAATANQITATKRAADIKAALVKAEQAAKLASILAAPAKQIVINGKAINIATFETQKVEMQFEQGMIEHIFVYLKDGNDVIYKFENHYPISVTGKIDVSSTKLGKHRLFDKNGFTIYLVDVFENDGYNIILENFKKDYSPKDCIVNIDPNKDNKVILTKEKTSRLFEVKIYTDLVGVAPKTPNGLIQMEVNRKINIHTTRYSLCERKGYSWAFLIHIEPEFTLQKIENKFRELPFRSVNSVINNQLYRVNYASTLDIKQYQIFNIGADLNLFLLAFSKVNLYIDGGFRYGYTIASDSSTAVSVGNQNFDKPIERYGLNSFQIYPKIIFQTYPEKRWGLTLSYQPSYFRLRSNDLIQIKSYYKSDLQNFTSEKTTQWFQTFCLSAFFAPNSKDENGKLFLRYKFNSQFGDINSNYHQLQIGYSYFFKSKKKD